MPTKIKEIKPKQGAYFGDPTKKAQALRDMNAHKRADAFTQGVYGEQVTDPKNKKKLKFRGCAVGCAAFSAEVRKIQVKKQRKLSPLETESVVNNVSFNPHQLVKSHYNIPEHLARAEDHIFENLPVKEAKEWPLQFLKAIPTGANLTQVLSKLNSWLLGQEWDSYYGKLSHRSQDPEYKTSRQYLNSALIAEAFDLPDEVNGKPLTKAIERRETSRRARLIRNKLLELLRECKPNGIKS
jgi:hypothetical protein